VSKWWTMRCFDNWCQFCGIHVEKSIRELSEEKELRPFVDMLTRFILEIKKIDGTLCHTTKYFLFCLSLLFVR
jgi:hypothetical protein